MRPSGRDCADCLLGGGTIGAALGILLGLFGLFFSEPMCAALRGNSSSPVTIVGLLTFAGMGGLAGTGCGAIVGGFVHWWGENDNR